MKKHYWTVWVPRTKEQLKRNLKYYKKELEKLNDPEYVKKLIENMKKNLEDSIEECNRELKNIEEQGEDYNDYYND